MQVLQHNWVLKLASLALAVALFAFVRSEDQEVRREFMVEAEIPLMNGLELVDPAVPPAVRVTVTGPADRIEALRESDVRPVVRTEGYRPGRRAKLPVELRDSPALEDKELKVNWFPRQVDLLAEPRVSRTLPLVLEFDDARPEGWEWAQMPRTDARQVVVSGLKPAVDRVARVVAPLRSLPPDEEVVATAVVHAEDRAGAAIQEPITLEPAQVSVRARLKRRFWQKSVPVQPMFPAAPGARLRVTVVPPRVTVYGTDRALEDLYFLETPELTLPETPVRATREVTLEPPLGVTRIVPPKVRVTIEQSAGGEADTR